MLFSHKLLPLLTASAVLLCGCGEKGDIECPNRLLDYVGMSDAVNTVGVDFKLTRTVGDTLTPETPLLTPYLEMQRSAFFTCRCVLVGMGDGKEMHMFYHTANGYNYYLEQSSATAGKAYIEERGLLLDGVFYHDDGPLLYRTEESKTVDDFQRLYENYTFECSYEVTVGQTPLVCEEWKPPGLSTPHKLFFKEEQLIADVSQMGQSEVVAYYTTFCASPDVSLVH